MVEVTKHYLISGRVQGVGFRAFTHRLAVQMGLKGWVRNLSDGRVEAVARGASEILAQFEAGLKNGPPRAFVEAFLVRESQLEIIAATYEVRRDATEPCSEP